MVWSEAIDKVHGRYQTCLSRRTADMSKVGVCGGRGERTNDTTVKSDLGCKIGQVKMT